MLPVSLQCLTYTTPQGDISTTELECIKTITQRWLLTNQQPPESEKQIWGLLFAQNRTATKSNSQQTILLVWVLVNLLGFCSSATVVNTHTQTGVAFCISPIIVVKLRRTKVESEGKNVEKRNKWSFSMLEKWNKWWFLMPKRWNKWYFLMLKKRNKWRFSMLEKWNRCFCKQDFAGGRGRIARCARDPMGGGFT